MKPRTRLVRGSGPRPARVAVAAGTGTIAVLTLVALTLVACSRRTADRTPADSGTAGAAGPTGSTPAPGAMPAASPAPASDAEPVRVAVEAKQVCAAVAAWWRRDGSAGVRVADSLVATPMGDVVTGCVVAARQEHEPKRDSSASRDSSAASQDPRTTLMRATGTGWTELRRFMADGPNGASSAFQRGPVRCAVALSWDGGDDSDPSYVPEDWYEEDIICWWAPQGIAVSDTAP